MSVDIVKSYTTPHKPKGFGVGPFGPIGSLLLAVLTFTVILLIPSLGTVVAVAVGAIGVLILGLMVRKDRHNQSLLDKAGDKASHRTSKRNGSDTYFSGSLTDKGSHVLPGVLTKSKLHTWTDKNGAEFTILEYGSVYVVNISAEPDGSSVIDPEDRERQVSKYGDWISSLATVSRELVQASVCLESSQDTGPTLTLEMKNNASPMASEVSKEWAKQVLDTYPVGSTTIRAYITLTFKAPDPGLDLEGNKIKGQDPVEAIARLVADRLPNIMEDIPETGAGMVSAMTAEEVIEVVKCAYNPELRKAYDVLASKGEQPPVTNWNSVGPSAGKKHWDYYQHSGGASITWEVSGFVSDEVISTVLMPLLEPSAEVSVKRITFLYQPIDPAAAAVLAEHDHRNAHNRAASAKNTSAEQILKAENANKVRTNRARGHALVDMSILVTATVLDVNKLPAARAVVEHQGGSASLSLRTMYGVQDSAFAQALGPLGLVTKRHLNIPTSLSQGV